MSTTTTTAARAPRRCLSWSGKRRPSSTRPWPGSTAGGPVVPLGPFLRPPSDAINPPEPFCPDIKDRPYDGEVAYVDSALEGALRCPAGRGDSGRTVVVLTATTGRSLGEHGETTHGYFAYNATLQVPLIIAGPGAKPASARDGLPRRHLPDRLRPPGSGQAGLASRGGSLCPGAQGEAPSAARDIYFESLYAYLQPRLGPATGLSSAAVINIWIRPSPSSTTSANDFGELKNLAEASDLAACQKASKRPVAASDLTFGRGPGKARPGPPRRSSGAWAMSLAPPSRPERPSRRDDDLKVLLPSRASSRRPCAYTTKELRRKRSRSSKEVIAGRKDFDLAYTYLATIYKEQGQPGRTPWTVPPEALPGQPRELPDPDRPSAIS